MNNKNKIAILSLIALAIIGILSGASYAYFSVGNKQGNNTVIESGTMALTFTDGPQINATNLIPGEYIEKTFSVRNTGTVSTTYDVYLSEVINTFVQKSDLVYEITSNDGGYNTPSEVVVPNEESKIINQQSIGVGITHNYTLKITYKLTNQIQNDNMGRGFTAKININEYTTNNSEHLLKLLDTSNNIVDKQIISSGITEYYYNLANISLTGTTNIYCNNGGIPTIENNILKVSDITNDTECKISSDIVDTFTNKLSTTKTGIVMTNNQDNTTRLLVPESKEVVFDLNGKTINSAGLNLASGSWNESYVGVRITGTLTINDSVGTGGINTGVNEPVLVMNSGGTLYVNGGNYNGTYSFYNLASNTYTEINGGTFDTNANTNFFIHGSNNNRLVINNITINHSMYGKAVFLLNCNSNTSTIDFNNGNININENAWIFTTGTGNKGTININNGNFSNTSTGIIGLRDGTLNINGGTFSTPNSYLLTTNDGFSGTININEGTFNSESNTITNYGTNNIININNGVFESVSGNVVKNNLGTTNINGGSFFGGSAYVVLNTNGTMNISDGKFIGGTATTINNSSLMNITGGYFVNSNVNTITSATSSTTNINASNAIFDNDGNLISGLYVEAHNGTPALIPTGTVYIYGGTFTQKCDNANSNCNSPIYHYKGEMRIYDCLVEQDGSVSINSVSDNLYIYDGTFNGEFRTATYNGFSGSQNYICGGTFKESFNNHNICAVDTSSSIKYKSNVVWVGRTSPILTGPAYVNVSLDDTIVCP